MECKIITLRSHRVCVPCYTRSAQAQCIAWGVYASRVVPAACSATSLRLEKFREKSHESAIFLVL